MSTLTPIRVRGKKSAIKAEKWHAGKKRKANRDASPASPARSCAASSTSSRAASAAPSRKRKRRDPQLSRLEELPTEILQAIFDFSANLDLPLASPRLLAQLSSHHVYMSLTSRIMRLVVGHTAICTATEGQLSAAARLLGCRFMTWSFFQTWLKDHYDYERPLDTQSTAGGFAVTSSAEHVGDFDCPHAWMLLCPAPHLLPPRKLLHGPWTSDKIRFLHVLGIDGPDIGAISPVDSELAYEGLHQAVAQRSLFAVHALLRLQLQPDTELLRQAVIDHGCDEDIVGLLIRRPYRSAASPEHETVVSAGRESNIDVLDPALWAWADKARKNADRKGRWLMDLLKKRAREGREPDFEFPASLDNGSTTDA